MLQIISKGLNDSSTHQIHNCVKIDLFTLHLCSNLTLGLNKSKHPYQVGFEAVPEGPSGAIQVLHIYSNNLVFKFTVAENINLIDI